MFKFNRKSTLTALLAGIFLLVSQTGSASTLTFDSYKWGSVTASVSTSAPLDAPVATSLGAGGFNVHVDTGASFEAWCMDVWQWLGGNNYTFQSSPLGLTVDAGKVTLTQTKIDDLNRLATEAHASINNATTSAAFQAAIWEIAFDNTGAYNIASGLFAVSAANTVTQQAQLWLDGLSNFSPSGYSLSVWSSPTQQDVLVFTKVPTPATYTLLFAGLGLISFTARRRQQNKAAKI